MGNVTFVSEQEIDRYHLHHLCRQLYDDLSSASFLAEVLSVPDLLLLVHHREQSLHSGY